ncbi:MAG TPA: hypothetical protein VM286_10365 [Candidatus Thermoplasmatota archaeon]|nr:hypothetical protein [Candidatus Thermoplasmatota archaeon]
MRSAWSVLLACLLVLVALPATDAQFSGGQLLFGSGRVLSPPVVVNQGSGFASVEAMYVCSGASELRLQDTVLRLDAIQAPRGVSIVGPKEVRVPQSACQGPLSQIWREELKFAITATPEAQGEKPLLFTVNGSVPSGGTVREARGTATIPFSVAYFGLLTASVPTPVGHALPGKSINYEVTVTNLGNANTNVDFALVGEVPEGWSPRLPTPVILGPSELSGGKDFTKTVVFQVATPEQATARNQTSVQLKITPRSTIDPQKGNELVVNVLAMVDSCDAAGPKDALTCEALSAGVADAPAPAALLFGAVLLGCAFVARRKWV